MATSPVQVFLKKLKSINPATVTISNQKKTRDYLNSRDFERVEVITYLYSLTEANFSYGPSQNDWGTGKVWTFGINVDNDLVYVKLCLTSIRNEHEMLCMSFHEAEHPLQFPFAKKK